MPGSTGIHRAATSLVLSLTYPARLRDNMKGKQAMKRTKFLSKIQKVIAKDWECQQSIENFVLTVRIFQITQPHIICFRKVPFRLQAFPVAGPAGVLESDFYSAEHQSNLKASSSQCWATPEVNSTCGLSRQHHFESSPKAYYSDAVIICPPPKLPSPVEFRKTSMQGSLYPLHLQESNKTDISDAEKSNSDCAVPLNQALNRNMFTHMEFVGIVSCY
ncbi:hypothetical protein WISP_61127 [Willisornis vidua]|uniref:Uncharacterized protein n=1 Tax=Willisornis vidua TaxID=1566151 RepID=A0ABQ9DB11_9PASS|nr:hypothetical protein WISP_61127 [Willisornis vidua]